MPQMNMIEAINDALYYAMSTDKKVVVLGEDIGKDGGVFRATVGLLKKFGKERVLDTPLAESGIVGVSIGMAVYGLKPVAEIQFMGFIYPAFDQIISHAAKIRTRSRGKYTCPLVIRTPYGGGVHAPEHHSESTETIFIHTPGIKVVVPATPADAKGLLLAAIRDPDPVIFLEPEKLYHGEKEEVPIGDHIVELGKAHVVQEGTDITFICWGAMLPIVKKAAQQAAAKGISAEIIDLRTLSPVDKSAIINSVKKTGRCIIVHEAPRTAGFGAELSAQIMENCLLTLKAPVERVTGYDTAMPLYKLEKYYMPDEQKIMKAVEKVMMF